MADHSNPPALPLQRLQRVYDDVEGRGIERAESFIDEQRVDE